MKQFQEDFNLPEDQKQEIRDLVNSLDNFVNTLGNKEGQEFFTFMLTRATHRTLQQGIMRLFWQAIETWASLPPNQYDGRNEATVNACKQIVEKNKDIYLPFI